MFILKKRFLLAIIIASLAITQPALAVTITDFSSTSGLLQLNGTYNDGGGGGTWTPQIVNNNLQLTNDYHQAGSAFLKQPIMFGGASDIDTEFKFKITNTDLGGLGQGADGLAFVIQSKGSTAIGQSGSALGYAARDGNVNDAIYKSFAVEFRTFPSQQIAITEVNPSNGSIIQLASQAITNQVLNDSTIQDVSIHYKGSTNLLQVYLNGVYEMEAYVPIIQQIFPQAYFGFTASTGDHTQISEIVSWTLTVPEPSSIMLFSLGLVTLVVVKRQAT
jgi:hypothetical protein